MNCHVVGSRVSVKHFNAKLAAAIICFSFPAYAEQAMEPPLVTIEQKSVEEKTGDKVVEKNYYYKEIIKEVPKEEEEYIKHLYEELKSPLRKPKKIAAVRRVEDDLVEINKGAIHRVREGDVYQIRDRNNRAKARIEIEAIADTVSIGRSYFVDNPIEVLDKATFVGQRRFWGSGGLGGMSVYDTNRLFRAEPYRGYGLCWRFLFRKSWGIAAAAAAYEKKEFADFGPDDMSAGMTDLSKNPPRGWDQFLFDSRYLSSTERVSRLGYYESNYRFVGPIEIRRYFWHPAWYSSYVGVGAGHFRAQYKFQVTDMRQQLATAYWGEYWNATEVQSYVFADSAVQRFVPVLTAGTEISFGKYFRLVISGTYFHGPKINISGYEPLTRPLIASAAIIGTW